MKKLWISVFLAVLLILPFSFSVSAAGSAGVTASASSAKVGENITFTVTLLGTEPVTSASVQVDYDSNVFEYVSFSFAKAADAFMKNYDASKKTGALAFTSAADVNGTYFTITLKVKSGAASAQNVSISVQLRNGATDLGTVSGSRSVQAQCASHTFGDWTQTKAPSCGVKGQETKTCSVCGAKETKDIDALQHNWSAWTQTTAPDCETKGVESHTCSICKKTETRDVAALGHDWNAWTVTTPAGCETKGVETHTCKRNANHTETRDVAATGHSWGAWTQTKKPDCETKGEESRTCSSCKKTEKRDVAALGHNFSNPTITKEPTCTQPGESTGTCTRCQKTTTQSVKALGHSWGAWQESKKADCEKAGEETRSCTRCKEEQKRAVAALGHDFEDPVVVKEATLTETGLLQGKCRRCGKTTEQVIPCKAADEKTGIEVQAEDGTFAAGTEFKAEKVEEDSGNYESVKNALSEVSPKFEAFDLGASLNGEAAQPQKPVTVALPVPEGFSDKAALYAIAEDGTVTEIESALSEDGKTLTAALETLGRVAIVDLAAESKPDEPQTDPAVDQPGTDAPAPSATEQKKEEDSGSAAPIIAIAVVAVLAVAAAVFFWIKKKK